MVYSYRVNEENKPEPKTYKKKTGFPKGKKKTGNPALHTWKAFEYEVAYIFGGRRVPLSGKMSGHNTSADVMFPEAAPCRDWLYIEAKRSEAFNKMLYREYRELLDDCIILTPLEGENSFLCFFSLQWFIRHLDTPFLVWVAERGSVFDRKPTKLLHLYKKTRQLAAKEGKDVPLCAFRLHKRKHMVCAVDYKHLPRLRSWLKKIRAPMAARLSKPFSTYVVRGTLHEKPLISKELKQDSSDLITLWAEECREEES